MRVLNRYIEKVVPILIIVIAGLYLFATRNDSFQECDSASVYHVLKNYPETAYMFSMSIGPSFADVTLSKDTASKFTSIAQRCFPEKSVDKMAVYLNDFNVVRYMRVATIRIMDLVNLPPIIKRMVAFPLSGTFSLGPGIIYSTIYSLTDSYSQFMSVSLATTTIVFITSVWLFLEIMRNLRVDSPVSLLMTGIFLFSISSYSYSRHLGSTVWLISTTILWLYFLSRPARSAANMALVSLVLFCFNYFIFIFFIAFLIYDFICSRYRSFSASASSPKRFKVVLWTTYSMLFILGMFFPFGQTSPSKTNLAVFWDDLYFIGLNQFTILKIYHLESIQLGVGLIITSLAVFASTRNKSSFGTTHGSILFSIRFFFAIWFLLVAASTLALAPTRHIIFVGPLILILSAIALSEFCEKYEWVKTSVSILTVLVLVTGWAGMTSRVHEMRNSAVLPNSVLGKYDLILVNDCSFNLLYSFGAQNIPIYLANYDMALDPGDRLKAIPIPVGKRILYISQTTSFSRWINSSTIADSIGPRIYRVSGGEGELVTNVFFTAYNPDNKFTDPRFAHNRPNNFYYQTFEIDN